MLNSPLKTQYIALWESCIVTNPHGADAIVDRITNHKSRYDIVASNTHFPWFIVGVIHSLEASLNFNCHLHNGDPLIARTVHVPAGRPLEGNPPFTWEASAIDALQNMPRFKFDCIENILYFLEGYNGFGYERHGINTPYLWGGTNQYTKGKFGADGKFNPELVSLQVGGAALLKQFYLRDITHGTIKNS